MSGTTYRIDIEVIERIAEALERIADALESYEFDVKLQENEKPAKS